ELGMFLDELARPGPLVLFLDDVHWADGPTGDLLAYLSSRCATRPVLLVLTYRPADLALGNPTLQQALRELQGRGLGQEVHLGLLLRADVEGYLAARFPGHAFPTELAGIVHQRTEGNPLFLVDLLEHLCDRGVIAVAQGRWALAQALPDLRRE